MKQKDIFLESEGNAWFNRNLRGLAERRVTESDPLLSAVLSLSTLLPGENTSVLEIGCGDGARLAWLMDNLKCRCFGVDPSADAVKVATDHGVAAQQGTADRLPFDDSKFDIVIFGFCLYLCDREDLFRVAHEADRVLRNPGWLLILDFYSPMHLKRDYHHRSGLYSYKMDYRSLFTWNPGYITYSHKVQHHSEGGYTDDASEWTAISILRKNYERS